VAVDFAAAHVVARTAPNARLPSAYRELRRPNVTPALQWDEYRAGAKDGFSYCWFEDLYRVSR